MGLTSLLLTRGELWEPDLSTALRCWSGIYRDDGIRELLVFGVDQLGLVASTSGLGSSAYVCGWRDSQDANNLERLYLSAV